MGAIRGSVLWWLGMNESKQHEQREHRTPEDYRREEEERRRKEDEDAFRKQDEERLRWEHEYGPGNRVPGIECLLKDLIAGYYLDNTMVALDTAHYYCLNGVPVKEGMGGQRIVAEDCPAQTLNVLCNEGFVISSRKEMLEKARAMGIHS